LKTVGYEPHELYFFGADVTPLWLDDVNNNFQSVRLEEYNRIKISYKLRTI
jgi:hypothetical protein